MTFKLTHTLSTLILVFVSLNGFAQSSIEEAVQKKIAKKNVPGAQLGSLVCENADGKLILCSGSLEETVAGIVTNVPYITLNKPASPEASKSIFNAQVSAESGLIVKGDLLKAGTNGTLNRCDENEASLAYAVALEDVGGQKTIRVKLLKR